jgi:hypothetical protein
MRACRERRWALYGQFEEAAVVKFVVAGAAAPTHLPKLGSCMDMHAANAAVSAYAEQVGTPRA